MNNQTDVEIRQRLKAELVFLPKPVTVSVALAYKHGFYIKADFSISRNKWSIINFNDTKMSKIDGLFNFTYGQDIRASRYYFDTLEEAIEAFERFYK